MRILLSFLTIILFSNISIAQTTAIPDPNFEQELINLGYDVVLDGQILTSNINTVTSLSVNSVNISDLTGIEDFTALTTLNCYNNLLTSLDLTQNTNITWIDCADNLLTSLDISQNVNLIDFRCYNNQLTSLDVSQNLSLANLRCYNNQISGGLDLSEHTSLNFLECQDNLFSCLNVKNGNNTNFIWFDASNNPNINCVEVDNATWSTSNWTNIDAGATFSTNCVNGCNGLYTAIPDANFEQALINLGLDSGPIDGLVLTTNIDTVTFLNVGSSNITDLTGIESFTALVTLWCGNNQLTSLNVTQNLALDALSCAGNLLSTIDLTQNTTLTSLGFGADYITTIDVSQNINLRTLNAIFSPLSSLDITQNINLESIYFESTQLTGLDISQNSALINLGVYNGILTSIDASNNPNLTYISVQNNELTCMNIKNGNNTNLTTITTYNNPNLVCMEVDNPTYSTTNWTINIDAWTNFSTNCGNSCLPCTLVPSFSVIDNGNGNYSFTNTTLGNYNLTHWAFGNGTNSTATSPNYTFTTNGVFEVVLTVADSIAGSTCFDYYTTTINVTGVTSPLQCHSGFVMYPDTGINNVTVVNSSSGNNLTYTWDFGDGTSTSPLQNPSHVYATSGPFYLCLTVNDGAGCIDMFCDSIGVNGVVFKQAGFSINVISPIPTAVKPIPTVTDISIYPNPTTRHITIDLGTTQTNVTATLTNSLGQVVISKNYNSTNSINLNIDAPKGIYFLRLETDKAVITRKIIKE
jgi:PKD domain/Secretion system C-terminal sorting domain